MKTDEIKALAMLLGEELGDCFSCDGRGMSVSPWSHYKCAACRGSGIKLGEKTLEEINRREREWKWKTKCSA